MGNSFVSLILVFVVSLVRASSIRSRNCKQSHSLIATTDIQLVLWDFQSLPLSLSNEDGEEIHRYLELLYKQAKLLLQTHEPIFQSHSLSNYCFRKPNRICSEISIESCSSKHLCYVDLHVKVSRNWAWITLRSPKTVSNFLDWNVLAHFIHDSQSPTFTVGDDSNCRFFSILHGVWNLLDGLSRDWAIYSEQPTS